jgi:hypothetical protein
MKADRHVAEGGGLGAEDWLRRMKEGLVVEADDDGFVEIA